MNTDILEGKWEQLKGQIKTKWGKLTEDDVTSVNGKKEQLIGKVQERYGEMRDAAEKQVNEWLHTFDKATDKAMDKINEKPMRGEPKH